jgi:hypothetical protein
MQKQIFLFVGVFLCALLAYAQGFTIESIKEVASGPVASRFTNPFGLASGPVDAYDSIDVASPIRLCGARINIGHARNELFAYDLEAGRELWSRYLDAPPRPLRANAHARYSPELREPLHLRPSQGEPLVAAFPRHARKEEPRAPWQGEERLDLA